VTAVATNYKFPTEKSSDGSIRAVSSFGPDMTSFGLDPSHLGKAGYDAEALYNSERAKELDFRSSFYRCTNHNWKPFNMDGGLIGPQERSAPFEGAQPMMSTMSGPTSYVPLSARRPHAPVRIARTIVRAFTGMLFGHNRWPGIRSDDPDTQAFGEAVAKAANLRNRFVRARNLAGSCGTAALSWFFRQGSPRVRVHTGRFVHVLEWDDVDDYVVRHATELYQSWATRETEDGPQRYRVWVRRDWTPEADVVFKPIEVTGESPEQWVIDKERSFVHGDGFAHIVWLTNYPDDDEPSAVDGQPDYAELYDPMATLDVSNSVAVRGVMRNLDPTLVVKMDPMDVGAAMIKKGSDNALVVGEQGDADYLTIDGDVVTAGKEFVGTQREQILEVAQCVVPDPNEVAAGGTSSVAQKMMYAPMIGTADVLREPCGHALVQLLEQMKLSAANEMSRPPGEVQEYDVDLSEPESEPDALEQDDDVENFEAEEMTAADQEQPASAVEYYLDLPPRVVIDVVDGQKVERKVEIKPGEGKFWLEWGEYFPPTSQDKQAATEAVSSAAGGKSVLSQQTAVELASSLYNKDATEEWARVQAEREQDARETAGMFPGTGGEVDPNASEPVDTPAPDDDQETLITPTDMSVVTLVNEARASAGLGPLRTPEGQSDPDGWLTVEEFRAKRQAKGEQQGAVEGKVAAGVDPADAAADAIDAPAADAPPTDAADPPTGGGDITNQVDGILQGDFPDEAFDWVHDAKWTGPTSVPIDKIDTSQRDTWRASKEPGKVADFAGLMQAGGEDIKPVILVRWPGSKQLFVADGHHRVLAAEKAGVPVKAFIADVPQQNGPWMTMHSKQIPKAAGQ